VDGYQLLLRRLTENAQLILALRWFTNSTTKWDLEPLIPISSLPTIEDLASSTWLNRKLELDLSGSKSSRMVTINKPSNGVLINFEPAMANSTGQFPLTSHQETTLLEERSSPSTKASNFTELNLTSDAPRSPLVDLKPEHLVHHNWFPFQELTLLLMQESSSISTP